MVSCKTLVSTAAVSENTFPSTSVITLLARSITRWSWVEKMKVISSSLLSMAIMSNKLEADFESRLAVGSYANTNCGLDASALATPVFAAALR